MSVVSHPGMTTPSPSRKAAGWPREKELSNTLTLPLLGAQV